LILMGSELTGREWRSEAGLFQLVTTDRGMTFELRTPGGQKLKLSRTEWSTLRTELAVHFSATETHRRGADSKPASHGKPWSKDLDRELVRRWIAKEPLRTIAASMDRSRGGITSRLVFLGVVANREEARERRDGPPEFPSSLVR
jgi:hypothetical protein